MNENRVAIQVTASTNLKKIKKTLSQFRDKNYKSSFDELYVFTLTKKQSSYSQTSIDKETRGEFTFSATKNIVDPGDILQRITSLRIGAQERLLNEFKIILGDIKDRIAACNALEQPPLLFASNLVKVGYPRHIYIAELDVDISTTLKNAKDKLGFNKKKPSKATVVRLALVTSGVTRHDWIVHENKLFTFSKLDSESDFSSVVDIGSSEELDSEDFFTSELLEYRNLFNWLLKNTVKDMLEAHEVKWHKRENVFYFRPFTESSIIRKESWVGKKKSTRTVYEVKYQKKTPTKISHHKHLSFGLSFTSTEEGCYCIVNPSWLYTYNTYKKSYYHQDLLSKQKRLEFNHSIRDQVRFVSYFLSNLESRNTSDLCFLGIVEVECAYASFKDVEQIDFDEQEDKDED